MKNWTNSIALALMAATLTLTAACTEDGPGSVADVPAPEPGDPAIYAPDGWPLQIGDRISRQENSRLRSKFQTPGFTWSTRHAPTSLHVVGGRVYAPVFQKDYTKVGEYVRVYRGHFRVRLPESMREQEPDLPPEFHGRIEYYTPPPPSPWAVYFADRPKGLGPEPRSERTPELVAKLNHEQRLYWEANRTIGPLVDAEDRVINVAPWTPSPPDPLMWPDYPERRK